MEESTELEEAVKNLLHYAIHGRINSLTEEGELHTLYVANKSVEEVLQWAMTAGIIETEESQNEIK